MPKLAPPPTRSVTVDTFVWTGWFNKLWKAITQVVTTTATPTVSELSPGTWGIYKNTTTGTVKLYVNDNGTIKSVTLT